MQHRFRVYIDEKVSCGAHALLLLGGQLLIRQIDKHYARFGTTRHTAPAPDRADEIESLSSIVLLLREWTASSSSSSRYGTLLIR